MVLSPETIEKVNKRLLEPFDGLPVKKTDIGIVLGCRSASGTAAREAADLYHKGAYPKVMVTGGMRVFQPAVVLGLNFRQVFSSPMSHYFSLRSEAQHMRQVLLSCEVPDEDIIVAGDDQKKADRIVRSIREKLGDDFSSATLISYLPYSRRSIGTMRFQGVEIPFDVRGVKPFTLDVDNWHLSNVARYVVREAQNMDPDNPDGYVGKYTTAVDLEEEARLRSALPDFVL